MGELKLGPRGRNHIPTGPEALVTEILEIVKPAKPQYYSLWGFSRARYFDSKLDPNR
jgi:hypothetical protein